MFLFLATFQAGEKASLCMRQWSKTVQFARLTYTIAWKKMGQRRRGRDNLTLWVPLRWSLKTALLFWCSFAVSYPTAAFPWVIAHGARLLRSCFRVFLASAAKSTPSTQSLVQLGPVIFRLFLWKLTDLVCFITVSFGAGSLSESPLEAQDCFCITLSSQFVSTPPKKPP